MPTLASFENSFFSPYSQEYCLYFYVLMVVAFIYLAIALFESLRLFIDGELSILQVPMAVLGPFLHYFIARLLYSMCSGALN